VAGREAGVIAYKFLADGRVGPFSRVTWPAPGEWLDAGDDAAARACQHRIHACRPEDLAEWMDTELWRIELGGDVAVDCGKLVADRGRLLDRIEVWDAAFMTQFAEACALRARDAGVALVHQHLIYPMLDDRQNTVSSQWDLLAVWPRELNAFAWRCYLGPRYGSDDVPAYAAPARADDLAGLPPAYIHVGGLDGCVGECVDYAARLLAADVAVELHVLPCVPHGFDQVAPEATVTRTATALSDAALARVLS
jgi:hypothetical protein